MISQTACTTVWAPCCSVPWLLPTVYPTGPLQGSQDAGEDLMNSQSCPGLLLGHSRSTQTELGAENYSWVSQCGCFLIPLPVILSSRLLQRLLKKLSPETRGLLEVRCQNAFHMGPWDKKTVSYILCIHFCHDFCCCNG